MKHIKTIKTSLLLLHASTTAVCCKFAKCRAPEHLPIIRIFQRVRVKVDVEEPHPQHGHITPYIIAVRRCRECVTYRIRVHIVRCVESRVHARARSEYRVSLPRAHELEEPNYRARRRPSTVDACRLAAGEWVCVGPLCDGALRVFDFRQFGK